MIAACCHYDSLVHPLSFFTQSENYSMKLIRQLNLMLTRNIVFCHVNSEETFTQKYFMLHWIEMGELDKMPLINLTHSSFPID